MQGITNKTIKNFLNEINKTIKADISIANESIEIIAMSRVSIDESSLPSFNCFHYDVAANERCTDFLKKCVMRTFTESLDYMSERCWIGLRLMSKKMLIKDKFFYAIIDVFLLDTDTEFDDSEINGTTVLPAEIDAKRKQTRILTIEEVNEYFDKVEQFLNTLLPEQL